MRRNGIIILIVGIILVALLLFSTGLPTFNFDKNKIEDNNTIEIPTETQSTPIQEDTHSQSVSNQANSNNNQKPSSQGSQQASDNQGSSKNSV